MFGIGGFELFLILIFGFLIFGPDKLPAIAKTIGRAIAKFRDAQEEMSGQLKKESFIDKDSDEPFKNPLDVLESTAKEAKRGIKDAQDKADSATDSIVGAVASAGVKASSTKDEEGDAQTEHVASFAERKARYDQERKARKEAEAKAAAQAAKEKAKAEAKRAEERENPKADVAPKKVVEAADDAGDDAASDAEPAGKES